MLSPDKAKKKRRRIMSQSIFEQYEIFKTMHPVKIQVMKELAENVQGKSAKEAAFTKVCEEIPNFATSKR